MCYSYLYLTGKWIDFTKNASFTQKGRTNEYKRATAKQIFYQNRPYRTLQAWVALSCSLRLCLHLLGCLMKAGSLKVTFSWTHFSFLACLQPLWSVWREWRREVGWGKGTGQVSWETGCFILPLITQKYLLLPQVGLVHPQNSVFLV